ncbi:MAG: T9SS type A sorting domain-containing protein [Paludibacteraceae bacterium]|nr:T9SS type A sorting domain-containing protein [Paludibacteraceae bacterium]MBP7699898.1 T9SS type A sorting domain-containing protein [Saprospiraceae bacterium]
MKAKHIFIIYLLLQSLLTQAQIPEFYDLFKDVTWDRNFIELPNGNFLRLRNNILFVYEQAVAQEILSDYDSVTQVVTLYDANKIAIDSFEIKANEIGINIGGSSFLDTINNRFIRCSSIRDYTIPEYPLIGYRVWVFDFNLQLLEDHFMPTTFDYPVEYFYMSPTIRIAEDRTFITSEVVQFENSTNHVRYLKRYSFDGELLASVNGISNPEINILSNSIIKHNEYYYFLHTSNRKFIAKLDNQFNLVDSTSNLPFKICDYNYYNGAIYGCGADYEPFDWYTDSLFFSFGKVNLDDLSSELLFHYSYIDLFGIDTFYTTLLNNAWGSMGIFSSDNIYTIITKYFSGTYTVEYYILHNFKMNGEENWTYLLKKTPKPNTYHRFTDLELTDDGGVILYFYVTVYNDDGSSQTTLKYIKFSKDGEQEFVSGTTQPTNFVLEKILYFPNPTNNIVTISNLTKPNAAYQISNALGQLVQQGRVQSDNTLSVAALAKGIYFLNIEGHAPIKVVKE